MASPSIAQYSQDCRAFEASSVPVVVLGSGLTLIGVMRSLGPDRIPLYTICGDHDFVMRSRWHHPPPVSGDATPDTLPELLRWLPFKRAVLLPCSDDWLRAVAHLPKALSDRFPSSMGSSASIETMMDKWRFAQLLQFIDVSHPETQLINSYQEICETDPAKLQAVILKPLFSLDFAQKHGVKGYICQNKAEALYFGAGIDYPILLQEYIPGPPTENVFIDGFVDRHGRICVHFTRRRLRMYPARLGNSSFMISIAPSEVAPALDSLDKVLRATSLRGIFSAEFKHDVRDGQFKLLEINARPWWYVEFASHCGANVCRLAYRDALELPVEPISHFTVGRKCVLLPYDIRAFRDANGEIGFWSWARSWFGAHGALFMWNDPLPAITFVSRIGGASIKHRLAKVLRRINRSQDHSPHKGN